MNKQDELVDLDILREMAALDMFTEAQQDVLICLLKGMNHDEITKELGITKAAAWCRKRDAMKKYDKFLEEKKKGTNC